MTRVCLDNDLDPPVLAEEMRLALQKATQWNSRREAHEQASAAQLDEIQQAVAAERALQVKREEAAAVARVAAEAEQKAAADHRAAALKQVLEHKKDTRAHELERQRSEMGKQKLESDKEHNHAERLFELNKELSGVKDALDELGGRDAQQQQEQLRALQQQLRELEQQQVAARNEAASAATVAAAAAAADTAARAVELARLTALGAAAAQRETTAAQALKQMEARLRAAVREEGERQDAEREVANEAVEASGRAASAAPAPAPRLRLRHATRAPALGPPTAPAASAAPVRVSHAASTPRPTRRPASATPGGLGATPGSAGDVFYTPGEWRPEDYSRGSGIRQQVRRLTAAPAAAPAAAPPTHATRTARRCTCHTRRGCFSAPPSGRCLTACGSTCRRPLEPNLALTRLTRAHFFFARSRTRRSPRLRRRARPCASARPRSARPTPPRRRACPRHRFRRRLTSRA